MRTTRLILIALICTMGCNKPTPTDTAEVDEAPADASQFSPPEVMAAPTVNLDPRPDPLPVDTSPLGSRQPELYAPGPDAAPQQIVATFLEATRAGNDLLASSLLTRRALEETSKKGLTVQPPGSPSMSYQIGKIEAAPNNQGVYVSSVWTETFEDGEAESFEVVWVLRQEPTGWRIAGMAQLEPDELPLFLNFEEPTELARKMREGQPGMAQTDGQPAPPQSPAPPPPPRQARQPDPVVPR